MLTQSLSKESFKYRIIEQSKKPESMIHCLWRGRFDKKTTTVEFQASEYCMDIIVRGIEGCYIPQISFVEFEPEDFNTSQMKLDISNLEAINTIEIYFETIAVKDDGLNLLTQMHTLTHDDYKFKSKPVNEFENLILEINLKRKKMMNPNSSSKYGIWRNLSEKEKTLSTHITQKTRYTHQPVVIDMLLFEEINNIKYWGKIKPISRSKILEWLQPQSEKSVKLVTLSDFMELIINDFPIVKAS